MKSTAGADLLNFKRILFGLAVSLLQERIAIARQAMVNAQEAANAEEKSSAGDKYETARAMSQLDTAMYSRQLEGNLRELAILEANEPRTLLSSVQTGALVECDEGTIFFVAAGLGKVAHDGKLIYFLSPAAPLAIQLQRKSSGDSFRFNDKVLTITKVY